MKLYYTPGMKEVERILTGAGFSCYAVGGYVRDFLSGKGAGADIDMATDCPPEKSLELFLHYNVVPTGLKHGTVTIIADGEKIELTTFRKDMLYSDKRHPDRVCFTTDIESDLSRRDFTVNAVAYRTKTGFVDPFGGISDIEKGIIRAVGKPEDRFGEDILRVMRCFRLVSTLDYNIDPDTENAALAAIPSIWQVSTERIYTEVKKTILGQGIDKIIALYPSVLSTCLTESIVPKKIISPLSPHFPLRVAAFFDDNEKLQNGLRQLKADNSTKREAAAIINAKSIGSLSEARRMVGNHSLEIAGYVNEYRSWRYGDADILPHIIKIKENALCCKLSELAVTGEDLMKIGITGAKIGETLNYLLDKVIEGQIENTKQELLGISRTF